MVTYKKNKENRYAKSLRGASKSPNSVTSTFYNAAHLLPKGFRFDHGGAKLTSCPECYLTSLRPWTWVNCKPIIAWHQNCEPYAVWVSCRQINALHEKSQSMGIAADIRFSKKFWFLVQISRRENARFDLVRTLMVLTYHEFKTFCLSSV